MKSLPDESHFLRVVSSIISAWCRAREEQGDVAAVGWKDWSQMGSWAKRKSQVGLKCSKSQASSPAWPCVLSAPVRGLTCDAGGG